VIVIVRIIIIIIIIILMPKFGFKDKGLVKLIIGVVIIIMNFLTIK
jgi:hypothetical protein